MNKRWKIPATPPEEIQRMSERLCISPLLAKCLWLRGVRSETEIAAYLHPRLRGLGDPFDLPDMRLAVDRLLLARARREQIVVFGDYDVDGVTATALMIEFLRTHGWRAEAYLPHRRDEGYGLSADAVSNCVELHKCEVLLAVDCGSSSAETIASLSQSGIDTIVLDHHQLGEPVPKPAALVNPQRLPAHSPLRDLCSAGLAFKLLHALVKEGRNRGDAALEKSDVREALDLVALGTVADLVNLSRENRILVATGLDRLRQTRRAGLKALMKIARVREEVGVSEVAFQLAPRLNAAGRIEKATEALELLLATETEAAEGLATGLDERNQERQRIEKSIASEAIEAARGRAGADDPLVIVVGHQDWHIGVVGIVASRVLREFHRPTIVLGGDGPHWRGSGRSIEGFDLSMALKECSDLLVRSGGHAMAAGLTVAPGNVEALRARLHQIARSSLTPDQLTPSITLDAEAELRELNLEGIEALSKLEPIGQGNPPVRLCLRGVRVTRKPMRVGREMQHLKFQVGDGTSPGIEAIWWNAGAAVVSEGPIDVAFTPTINDYQGRRSPQLTVLDWKPSA